MGSESARQPTAEPAVSGTAAQTVPTAYSWRSRTGTVAGWLSSLENSTFSLVIVREVSRAILCRERWSRRPSRSSWVSRHLPTALACAAERKSTHSWTLGVRGPSANWVIFTSPSMYRLM